MTSDPQAAKRFYDPVAGWDIESQPSGDMDYRMIDTGDGLVGGTLTLSKEMRGLRACRLITQTRGCP